MKQFFIILASLFITSITFSQVGINTETPHASAILDVTSTTGGLLIPRMTNAERKEIPNPVGGLQVYVTDFEGGSFMYFDGDHWGTMQELPLGVGSFYKGGVVFYIFQSGDQGYVTGETHGLIVAVSDQSSSIQWYNGFNTTTGATATAVGTGSANTDAIIASQGATETSYAAGLARAYTGGAYTDWFLPSKDELNQMYLNKSTINTTASANSGNNFSNYYSSSTENSSSNAWIQGFSVGNQGLGSKDFTYNVRAVRAF